MILASDVAPNLLSIQKSNLLRENVDFWLVNVEES